MNESMGFSSEDHSRAIRLTSYNPQSGSEKVYELTIIGTCNPPMRLTVDQFNDLRLFFRKYEAMNNAR